MLPRNLHTRYLMPETVMRSRITPLCEQYAPPADRTTDFATAQRPHDRSLMPIGVRDCRLLEGRNTQATNARVARRRFLLPETVPHFCFGSAFFPRFLAPQIVRKTPIDGALRHIKDTSARVGKIAECPIAESTVTCTSSPSRTDATCMGYDRHKARFMRL